MKYRDNIFAIGHCNNYNITIVITTSNYYW